ncbi:endonuclease/exonuclease/phosphatase family protein [Actinoplanes sp. OR16]|uniref:endonuclease/exonuclease/phosphatase family protein n=1 Tax=Actinoplanes sp. OR16 TaxID=946334 RepID=UPI000FDAE3F1|nr:endonuclease/exonuclease/phosphatase family protein [Actinoplanes sp. OR16]
MTWNILHGGGDRLPAIIEVVREARPDILAMQELRSYGDSEVAVLEEATGMTAHLSRSLFGQPVAVLVRPPLTITRRSSVRWRLHHAAATVVVTTPSGPLSVVSTHLTPYSPYRRMREAVWLAARHASADGLVAIAGDLNGLAPGVDHTEALASLPLNHRRRHLSPSGGADTRAVAAFLAAGFTDLGRESGPTVPTIGLRGEEFAETRLDYVLASPALTEHARDLQVIRTDATDHASDHYPVRVELDL